MANGRHSAFPQLRRLVRLADIAQQTDRQLLEAFADRQEESAFEALVRRHGRLVMSVCRRILFHEQDAEDAFQAVFLVLARKAAVVAWRPSVGSWLYQVASRVALQAHARRLRREALDRRAVPRSSAETVADLSVHELRLALDEELARLPERFRVPLQLCYLQSKTQDEAARELGWTDGTLRGRLFRGRELLRKRLARRGLALSTVLLTSALAPPSSAVAGPLVGNTVQAAVCFASGQPVAEFVSSLTWSLTQEVLRTMFLTKVKWATAVVLAVGTLTLGTGLALGPALAQHVPFLGFLAGADSDSAVKPTKPEDENRFRPAAGLEGTIHALDTSKTPAVLTLNLGEDRPVKLSLDLAKGATVTIAGRSAALADLKPETEVRLILAADNRTVAAVEARGKMIEGELLRFDAATNTLTVPGDEDDQPAQTFVVSKDAVVYIDDYLGRPADLADCHAVTIELAADEKTVARVHATWAREGDPEGEIVAVNPEKGEVTVRVEIDEEEKELPLKTAADTKIFVNGQPARLADLKPGWGATVRMQDGVLQAARAVKRAPETDDDD